MKAFSYAQAAKPKATESVDVKPVVSPASNAPIAQKPMYFFCFFIQSFIVVLLVYRSPLLNPHRIYQSLN
jgi:hypothetical protein